MSVRSWPGIILMWAGAIMMLIRGVPVIAHYIVGSPIPPTTTGLLSVGIALFVVGMGLVARKKK